MSPAVLEDIRDVGGVFPHDALVGCETALIIFAAGFYGRYDAFWIAESGLTSTCVDVDQDKLDAMRALYPDGWEFVCMDAFEFASSSTQKWDVVTLDPWTQDFDRCADNIEAWCRLARHRVIVGTGVWTLVRAPGGWEASSPIRRSDYDGGVFWTVLERA